MTTTLIKNCRFGVVWDDDAVSHIYRSGIDIVLADDRIAFIGENYAGESDQVVDGANSLVMPGLIDIHSHPFSEPMNKGMWDEVGSPKIYNTSLYEYLPVLNPDEEGVKAAYGVALSEVLMSGVTTLCDISAPSEGWLDILADSGLRVSVAPMFRSGPWFTRNGFVVEYDLDEARGYRAFEAALREIDKAQAHSSGRLTGMICPVQIDTCTEGLLRDSFAEAVSRDLPYQIHAAQSLAEFHEIIRRHGKTPIEWLDSLGVLSPRTIIGHGIFLDHHPWTHWPETDDLGALARAGSTVAHCPTVFARRGIALRDFGRYVRRGVNMGIGTDVYPHNMLDEMRLVSYLGRVVSENPRSVSVAEIFNAATIGGARALGRDDIGRLSVGCKADVVIVDCAHPTMRPCYEPLRSLIYSASERAVTHVFVDGRQIVRDRKVLTIDYEAAAAALEEAQRRGLSRIRQLDWAGRSADELAGSAFPRR
jgi:cytosine/adenosine deaminase-related metal-dependent hydrolase